MTRVNQSSGCRITVFTKSREMDRKMDALLQSPLLSLGKAWNGSTHRKTPSKPILQSRCHGSWWLEIVAIQGINRHGTDLVFVDYYNKLSIYGWIKDRNHYLQSSNKPLPWKWWTNSLMYTCITTSQCVSYLDYIFIREKKDHNNYHSKHLLKSHSREYVTCTDSSAVESSGVNHVFHKIFTS